MNVLGYVRVSTDDQSNGAAAQTKALRDAATIRGWNLHIIEDRISGSKMGPSLTTAMTALGVGAFDALVVTKLDRLSRSTIHFGTILEQAKQQGWKVVVLDFDIDTSTPSGELVANIMIAVAQWERRTIGVRTKDGLAAIKAEGRKLGPPPKHDFKIRAQVHMLRLGGHSYGVIAKKLGIPKSTAAKLAA